MRKVISVSSYNLKKGVNVVPVNRAERSLGLIDGVYGVSVTLVAIDIPRSVLPFFIAGNWLSIEPITHLAVYIFQFLLMYDMWMLHKNISMKDEESFSRKTELMSMLVLGLVVFSPGIVSESHKIFIENLDLQSDDLNKLKIILYFYISIIYLVIFFMDNSKNKIKGIKQLFFNNIFKRCLLFFIFFIISVISNNFGWVLPVPIGILCMMLLNAFLSHPEYEK